MTVFGWRTNHIYCLMSLCLQNLSFLNFNMGEGCSSAAPLPHLFPWVHLWTTLSHLQKLFLGVSAYLSWNTVCLCYEDQSWWETIKVYRSSNDMCVIFVNFNHNWHMWTNFIKNPKLKISWTFIWWESLCSMQTDMMKLIVTCCNCFAHRPKKYS